jgi:hypothetical protein
VAGEERVKSRMFYLCGKVGAGASYAGKLLAALNNVPFSACLFFSLCGKTIFLFFPSLP